MERSYKSFKAAIKAATLEGLTHVYAIHTLDGIKWYIDRGLDRKTHNPPITSKMVMRKGL